MMGKRLNDYIVNTDLSKESVHYSRGRKFFLQNPLALSIFLNHWNEPLNQIYKIFLDNNIRSPRGGPYSLSTITVIKQFLKSIDISSFMTILGVVK